jgi:hypothetical protein
LDGRCRGESEFAGARNEAFSLRICQRETGVQILIATRALVRRSFIEPLDLPPGIAAARTATLVHPREGIGAGLGHESEYTIARRRFKREVMRGIREVLQGRRAGVFT